MLQFVFLPLVYCCFDDDDDVKDVCTVLLHSYDNNHGFCTDNFLALSLPLSFWEVGFVQQITEMFFQQIITTFSHVILFIMNKGLFYTSFSVWFCLS